MAEPVPLHVISARLRERQEAGRRHREVMYERGKEQRRLYARLARQRNRDGEDVALIRRSEALRRAREEARHDPRLADLVVDQERDERVRHIGARWILSLDAPHEGRGAAEDDPNGVWTLYDVIAAPDTEIAA